MILPFSTYFKDGTPNRFPEKILASLPLTEAPTWFDLYQRSGHLRKSTFGGKKYQPDFYEKPTPKLHTFREDKNERWRVGMEIHFTLFNHSKDAFQFAMAEVKGIQHIKIMESPFGIPFINVDGRELTQEQCSKLIKNDGFDSEKGFCDWFFPPNMLGEWHGKIIHWTDLRY